MNTKRSAKCTHVYKEEFLQNDVLYPAIRLNNTEKRNQNCSECVNPEILKNKEDKLTKNREISHERAK